MTLVPSESIKESLERTTTLYQQQLLETPEGSDYLNLRGITPWATAYFRLGFVKDPQPTDTHLRNRLAIPYITKSGIVGIKYRATEDDQNPKYVANTGFTAKRIFNPLFLTANHRKVYLCEGELDCITLIQLGIPSVGVPGVHNWDDRASRVFRNRSVVIAADGDDKGQGKLFAERVATGIDDCSIIILDGHDVNSFYLSNGPEELKGILGWRTTK